MRSMNSVSKFFRGRCLNDEDFYTLLSQSGKRPLPDLERHLTGCSYCRDRLTGLRELLDTKSEEIHETFPEPAPEEIQQTLALMAWATRHPYKSRFWAPTIAAALLVLVGLGAITAIHFMNERKGEDFLASGRSFLEQAYGAQSPSGLRLDLPFSSKATWREAPQEDPLDDAERLFYQALAVKEGMREAHLGLGYVYLCKGHFSEAREQFQALIDNRNSDYQAVLGRGITLVEEGLSLESPLDRKRRWEDALLDFENALRQKPDSIETLYNKILTFYHVGRFAEAVQGIEEYVSQDRQSLWARRLGDLRS